MQESTIDLSIVPVPQSQDVMTETRRDIKHDVRDLTLDMAMRVLRSAFAKPMLNEQEAIDLIDYHRERNDTAHQSHRKTWLAKHKRLAEELLL